MSPIDWTRQLKGPPLPPELPEAALPRWPAWSAPVALISTIAGAIIAVFPILPVILLAGSDTGGGGVAATALLIAILVQDAVLVGAALVYAMITLKPRPWHFGLRSTCWRPTIGWAALAAILLLAFEIGYVELLRLDEGNIEDFGADVSVFAAIMVSLAVIVVAPVTEEFFFRGFFYRALRTRLRVWSAALIDGVVFASLHFEGFATAATLPVIAVFGIAVCLVYERTGSLFSVIAIHAAFNSFAIASTGVSPVVPIVIGLLTLAGCVIVPRRLGIGPSPFAGARRRRSRLAAA